MNFKKVAFVPLMALLLVGCGANTDRSGKGSGSSSGSQGGDDAFDVSEPAGTQVTGDVAKQAINSAATSLLGQNNIGFDLSHTELEAHVSQKVPLTATEMAEVVKVDASVSDVTFKVRAEGLKSENPNQDFKASVDLGLTADVKGKVATDADEETGAIQYTNINLDGSAAASAYLVGNQPYVNVPESNSKLFTDVVSFLTENGIVEAEEIPDITFPIKYHLTGLDLDLSALPAAVASLSEGLEENIGVMVDELGQMPSEFGTLKFIQESETKLALYADINANEPSTYNYDGVEYDMGGVQIKVKGYIEIDTTLGLSKVALTLEVVSYTTLFGQYGPDMLEAGLSKEMLESHYQDVTIKGQAQVNFVYGENAKAQIPADLASYTDIDLAPVEDEDDGE